MVVPEEAREASEVDRAFAETNRIAAEGNRITAEGERVTAGEVRAAINAGRDEKRLKIGWAQVGAYLLIVAMAVYGFTVADQSRRALNRSQECTEKFLAHTVEASLARSEAVRVVQVADRAQNLAWSGYVDVQLRGAKTGKPATLKEQIVFVERYFEKLNAYLTALDKAEADRVKKPFPTEKAYKDCVASSD